MPVAQPFLNTPGQVGALAGYSDGMRMSYGLADLDREFRDRDLANKSNTLKYEEDLANVPLNEATRGVKMGMAGIDQALIDQGLVEQGRKDEFALKGYQAEEGRLKVDAATRAERAEAVQEGLQIFSNPNLANSDLWKEYYTKMTEKHKMRGLSPDFRDPNNIAVLKAANTAYVNSAAQQRQLALDAANNASREKVGAAHDAASRANSQDLAADRLAAKEAGLTNDKKIINLANQIRNQTGGVVPFELVDAYRSETDKKDETAITNQTRVEMEDIHRQKRDGNLVNYVRSRGIIIADEKVPQGPLARELAIMTIKETAIKESWKALKSPNIPAQDMPKIEAEYPAFAKFLKDNNKVGAAPQAPAATPAQPRAPVKEISQAEFEQKIALAKQQNPSIPEADLRASAMKRYKVLGATSVSTPATSQGAIDSHVPPRQSGGTADINQEILNKVKASITDSSQNQGVADINQRILKALGL